MLSSVPYVYPMAIAANAKYGINPVSIAYAYTMDQNVPRMLCLPTFYAML
jgi:Mg2+/citrate symporter